MALRRQVIDLLRLNLLNNPNEIGGIGQIAVVKLEAHVFLVRVLVQVVNTVGIKGRCTAFDAMNVIAFGEQKLG